MVLRSEIRHREVVHRSKAAKSFRERHTIAYVRQTGALATGKSCSASATRPATHPMEDGAFHRLFMSLTSPHHEGLV